VESCSLPNQNLGASGGGNLFIQSFSGCSFSSSYSSFAKIATARPTLGVIKSAWIV